MQYLLDLPCWDATATNFSEYSDRTMNFYHCCCTCSKKRDFYPNKILHRGVCHMSRVKLQTSIWSKFWISSAYSETSMNFYLRLLLHLFTARFFCVLLLVLHFPMKVFAVHQSSMVNEAGTPDLSQCNNMKNEEFFDNFCEQYQIHGIKFLYQDISTNSVRLKNMSEFLVSSTINYFRCQTQPSQNILGLFCDHLPTVALLNLTHEFFNNKTYCQTHLKKVFQADAYAQCDYLDFEKIIHHFAPYADYSFQSNTSVCLVSFNISCNIMYVLDPIRGRVHWLTACEIFARLWFNSWSIRVKTWNLSSELCCLMLSIIICSYLPSVLVEVTVVLLFCINHPHPLRH